MQESGNDIEEQQYPHFIQSTSDGAASNLQIDLSAGTKKPCQVVEENQRKTYPKRIRTKTAIYTNEQYDSDDKDNDNIPKPVQKDKRTTLPKPLTKKIQKPQTVDNMKLYDDEDLKLNNLQPFTPERTPGHQLSSNQLRGKKSALDFFSLFFGEQVISKIAKHTNEYDHKTIYNKSTNSKESGEWKETSPEEIRRLIALLLYQGFVRVSSFKSYWSTKSLYHGLWAREIMSRNRYSALMSMIHIETCSR